MLSDALQAQVGLIMDKLISVLSQFESAGFEVAVGGKDHKLIIAFGDSERIHSSVLFWNALGNVFDLSSPGYSYFKFFLRSYGLSNPIRSTTSYWKSH